MPGRLSKAMRFQSSPVKPRTPSLPDVIQINQKVDTWLLVWGGPGDWQSEVNRAVEQVKADNPDAHTILSREIKGERWSLLLVHYSKAECDAVAGILCETWTYGFVNAVLDLADLNDS